MRGNEALPEQSSGKLTSLPLANNEFAFGKLGKYHT